MAVKIKSGPRKPTAADLEDKQLGFDSTNKKLYIKNGNTGAAEIIQIGTSDANEILYNPGTTQDPSSPGSVSAKLDDFIASTGNSVENAVMKNSEISQALLGDLTVPAQTGELSSSSNRLTTEARLKTVSDIAVIASENGTTAIEDAASALEAAGNAASDASEALSKANEAYDLADAAMPITGGTFTGAITLPENTLGTTNRAATEKQVTTAIASAKLSAQKWLSAVSTVTELKAKSTPAGTTYLCRLLKTVEVQGAGDPVTWHEGVYQFIPGEGPGEGEWLKYGDNNDFIDATELNTKLADYDLKTDLDDYVKTEDLNDLVDDSAVVHLAEAETITGVKTFSALPLISKAVGINFEITSSGITIDEGTWA
jgi:hypothetical protein